MCVCIHTYIYIYIFNIGDDVKINAATADHQPRADRHEHDNNNKFLSSYNDNNNKFPRTCNTLNPKP